jgi:hypothetical protein
MAIRTNAKRFRCFWSFPAVSLPRPRSQPCVVAKYMIYNDFLLWGEPGKNFTRFFPARQGTGEAADHGL